MLGSSSQRVKALADPADIWIINRENVEWLVEYYGRAWPFDLVVIDESSSFKNHRAKRFVALKKVRPCIRRIVELTGTPAPNSLIDLWAQVYLLDGGVRLGKTIGGYRERYFDPDKRNAQQIFSYRPKSGAGNAIRDRLGDICISMRAEDYLQLPDIVIDDIPVQLDAAARNAYDRMERDLLLDVDDTTITAATAAALSNKLLQMCNGSVYDPDGNVIRIHDAKSEAFGELLEQLHGAPALVFYNFVHDRDRLEALLAKTPLRTRRLEGPDDERAWNAREVDVLLAHPASAAYGLNLQDGGNHIIWYGLNWSLEAYQQANKRLHRQGQTQKVIVHRLIVEGARDEDVIAALDNKAATQNTLIDSLAARIRTAKEARRHGVETIQR